mmetsp:Transcript_85236/g.264874  ORF Transcript_85236/g.264874 Transcript_85236/m.264874 type:complete len:212 (+) Transcript_85236:647-1282(+)
MPKHANQRHSCVVHVRPDVGQPPCEEQRAHQGQDGGRRGGQAAPLGQPGLQRRRAGELAPGGAALAGEAAPYAPGGWGGRVQRPRDRASQQRVRVHRGEALHEELVARGVTAGALRLRRPWARRGGAGAPALGVRVAARGRARRGGRRRGRAREVAAVARILREAPEEFPHDLRLERGEDPAGAAELLSQPPRARQPLGCTSGRSTCPDKI